MQKLYQLQLIMHSVLNRKNSLFNELLYFGENRDDCFSLRVGTENRLRSFCSFLDTLNPDLKFIMETGGKDICFLDSKIYIANGKSELSVVITPYSNLLTCTYICMLSHVINHHPYHVYVELINPLMHNVLKWSDIL